MLSTAGTKSSRRVLVCARRALCAATANINASVARPLFVRTVDTPMTTTTTTMNHSRSNWLSTAAVQQNDPEDTVAATQTRSKKEASSSSSSTTATDPNRKYRYFQDVEVTPSGVAIIRFDCPNQSVNTISFALSREAQELWKNEIETRNDLRAVVFASAKPGTFIAGADIFDIQSLENKQDVVKVIEDGLDFFQSMKKKGLPLVAAIDGPALGGGLEWALWCDYRVCTDSSKTKLGLPEVKLGLLPGFGGTQNLHPLVGLQNAMDMMLTGKDIRPDKARKMGLVDLVVAPASLESVAIDCAEQLADKSLKPKRKPKSWLNKALEDNPLGRYVLWNQVEKMVEKNTHGNYPAPLAIIECVKNGLDKPKGNAKYKFERESFAKLAATPESEALIGIFDGMTQMKKHPFGPNTNPLEVKTVAVMGAGLMGAGKFVSCCA